MELKIFNTHLVYSLYGDVENNLPLYESGNFDELLKKHSTHILTVKDVFIDESVFSQLTPIDRGEYDAKNAFLLYNAFTNLDPYLAVDERIWVALCHQNAKDFASKRWLKNIKDKNEKISKIKAHFFAKGTRGLQRDNALSCLWWWAYLIGRTNPKDHAASIKLLCTFTDLREQVVGRTSTSRGEIAFQAILKCIEKKYSADPDTKLFTRQKIKGNTGDAPYIQWLKIINRFGGRKFMEAFTVKQLSDIFYSFLEEVEQSISGP